MARIWLKVVPKMTSQRIGWIARVTSSLRSCRSFCSSTRQNVPTREASRRRPGAASLVSPDGARCDEWL